MHPSCHVAKPSVHTLTAQDESLLKPVAKHGQAMSILNPQTGLWLRAAVLFKQLLADAQHIALPWHSREYRSAEKIQAGMWQVVPKKKGILFRQRTRDPSQEICLHYKPRSCGRREGQLQGEVSTEVQYHQPRDLSGYFRILR